MPIIPPASPIPATPFTDEDYTNLMGHLNNIKIALGHLNLAQQAGVDVNEQRRLLTESQDKLLKLKNAYFPHR